MFYSNLGPFGGKFLKIIEEEFQQSNGVSIASGYVSLDVINKFRKDFFRIAESGGISRLLVGMAFYEGLSSTKYKTLSDIDNELKEICKKNGVFVSYGEKFHGKVYAFSKDRNLNIYIGSSNFSTSGLEGNIECTVLVNDTDVRQKAKNFIEFIFNEENAVSIVKADIAVHGTTKYLDRIKIDSLDDLTKYDQTTINKNEYEFFEFSLSRIADKFKSNLNVYFGKGRLNSETGKVTPRPWYEVELIADREIHTDPMYPRGEFLGYTDDGIIIPMKTSGDYFKNIRSKDSLQILGQWIKGKLQRSGALKPLTPVTQDTLDLYGNDTIRFYKIEDGKYYMEF